MQRRVEELVQKAIEKTPAGALVYGFELARTVGFAAQSLSFPFWEKLLTGASAKLDNENFLKNHREAFTELNRLLQQDADNIRNGIYPWTVLKPRPLRENLRTFPKVMKDAFAVLRRREGKKAHDFDEETKAALGDAPEYYRRNFHFQTGGYFTRESAEIYEYQVELLFSGAADAMRRLILVPLREKFGDGDGQGLHFLEVASGTGRLAHFVKLMYPKARLTLLDLSDAYLMRARQELAPFEKVDFLRGDAADLPFGDAKFDAVFSCFLFHELPREVRERVLAEGARVLKPQGFYGFVDSLQKGDKPDFHWALERFPVDFHEPFYKNYIETPMEPLLERAGLSLQGSSLGFFSKCAWAEKSLKA